MLERPPITNLLLLSVLTGILLVSGSLQCAFDCLTRLDNSDHPAVRVNVCHYVSCQPVASISCPSKTCHRGSPYEHHLGDPEYHNQQLQNQPLVCSSPANPPTAKTGGAFARCFQEQRQLLAFRTDFLLPPLQSLNEIRTTVLLN